MVPHLRALDEVAKGVGRVLGRDTLCDGEPENPADPNQVRLGGHGLVLHAFHNRAQFAAGNALDRTVADLRKDDVVHGQANAAVVTLRPMRFVMSNPAFRDGSECVRTLADRVVLPAAALLGGIDALLYQIPQAPPLLPRILEPDFAGTIASRP